MRLIKPSYRSSLCYIRARRRVVVWKIKLKLYALKKRWTGIMMENQTIPKIFFPDTGELDVEKWFLMSSPLPVISILIAYLAFVLKTGPDFMKQKKPFQLSNILICYNTVQVIVSVILFFEGCNLILNNGLLSPRKCIADHEDLKIYTALATYYYFIAKVTELLDTVFFVLRKKNNQITFLHVYHHTSMVLITWSTLKYEPTYSTIFLGTINSFVHIVMYAYYGLSSFPSLTRYLWWKKYLTTIQMVQFLLVTAQAIVSYKITSCRPSYIIFSTIIFNALLFLILFGNFYLKSYSSEKKKEEKKLK